MDERIDLTENRDFREERKISSILEKSVNKQVQSISDNINFKKIIEISGNSLKISPTLDYYTDDHICHRCGRKHFGSSTLCDKCDEELKYKVI